MSEPTQEPIKHTMGPSLLEAFEVGYELARFILSSHCYDARDLGRFWLMEHPDWVKAVGRAYDESGVWNKTKDAGIGVALRELRAALESAGNQNRLRLEMFAELAVFLGRVRAKPSSRIDSKFYGEIVALLARVEELGK